MAGLGKWSTKRVEEVLKQLSTLGTLPKNNPFHEGDVELRAARLDYAYTNHELAELAKCMENILYFGEEYCNVMTDEGIKKVKLRPYQRKVLLQLKKYRHTIWCASRQIGKCVSFDTEVEISLDGKTSAGKIPIFELHYDFKRNKRWPDYIEWYLYRAAFWVRQKIKKLEMA